METLSFGIRAHPRYGDNFTIFRKHCAILTPDSARIHAHVGGALVDVVTFPDQNGESGEILLQIFHSDGTEEGKE